MSLNTKTEQVLTFNKYEPIKTWTNTKFYLNLVVIISENSMCTKTNIFSLKSPRQNMQLHVVYEDVLYTSDYGNLNDL